MADNRDRGINQQRPEIVARGKSNEGDSITFRGGSSGLSGQGVDWTSEPQTMVKDNWLWQLVEDFSAPSGYRWDPIKEVKGAAGAGEGRNDALSAASAALSAFLQAQSLADARKMAAMENFQKLSKFALPAGAQFAPGYEPGGLAQTLAARQGLAEYTPPAITPREVNPGDVAGEIPPEVRAMIGRVQAAGGG